LELKKRHKEIFLSGNQEESDMEYMTSKKFSLPLDRQEVARSWGRRGYSCDVFIDPPGREWKDFLHSTNELVVVVEGKLRMTINGKEFVAEPGDEVFIPKGMCHSVKNIHATMTKWLYGYD
jgi:mannose-6-phosphate isomerase-like protein (cupin superfamily)